MNEFQQCLRKELIKADLPDPIKNELVSDIDLIEYITNNIQSIRKDLKIEERYPEIADVDDQTLVFVAFASLKQYRFKKSLQQMGIKTKA